MCWVYTHLLTDQVRRRAKELVYEEVLACKSDPPLQYVLCTAVRWDDFHVKDWILTGLAFAGAGFNIRHLGMMLLCMYAGTS